MLIIIFGIVLVVIISIIAAFATNSNHLRFSLTCLAVTIMLIALVIGIFDPVSGYNDWELVEETELVTLSNGAASGGTGLIYVSLSAEETYTYRYQIDSEFTTETSKEYKVETIVGKDVEEIEDPNCEKPVLKVYKRSGIMSIWTFALFASETKYVFYVPEGTISKDVKLN